MDYAIFCRSTKAISDVFLNELPVMLNHMLEERNGAALESLIRTGRLAEFAMFQVTSGINTHKGIIFLLLTVIYGIFHSALSYQEALDNASKYCMCLTNLRGCVNTTGARTYRLGLRGARGVVQDVFPSILSKYS